MLRYWAVRDGLSVQPVEPFHVHGCNQICLLGRGPPDREDEPNHRRLLVEHHILTFHLIFVRPTSTEALVP